LLSKDKKHLLTKDIRNINNSYSVIEENKDTDPQVQPQSMTEILHIAVTRIVKN